VNEDGGQFLFMYYLKLTVRACAISMIYYTKERSQIMAKVVDEAELVMIPLPLMDKWMTQHNS
jgi:CRP/FNR family transcriptional regulator